MQTIKLEAATKAEIILAIDEEFAISDVRKRIERSVRSIRVHDLLGQLDKACDEMKANLQTGPYDREKNKRWFAANDRWNRINKQLSKLQGI